MAERYLKGKFKYYPEQRRRFSYQSVATVMNGIDTTLRHKRKYTVSK